MNVMAIRDAMIEIQNDQLYYRLAEAGNLYVRQEFSSENTARRLMHLYDQLLRNFPNQQ